MYIYTLYVVLHLFLSTSSLFIMLNTTIVPKNKALFQNYFYSTQCASYALLKFKKIYFIKSL